MKFFRWIQSKLNGGQSDIRPVTIHTKKLESHKEEFNDWPNGLLTIGTFGNTNNNLKDKQVIQIDRNSAETEIPRCSSLDFSEFTDDEVVNLEKELKKLILTEKKASKELLNCPSSLDVERWISNRAITFTDNEEMDRAIRIIIGKCKDVCQKKKTFGKKSLTFLAKKLFVCRSGFSTAPDLRDTFQESRMDKLMRTLLNKKIYSQNSYRESSSKKYLEVKEEETKYVEGSKWDKTDSEYIVLDI